jgi:bacteriocin-like protein
MTAANTTANNIGRELTEDELDQIAGGVVPSIPIPPPGQQGLQYHIGQGGGAGKTTYPTGPV